MRASCAGPAFKRGRRRREWLRFFGSPRLLTAGLSRWNARLARGAATGRRLTLPPPPTRAGTAESERYTAKERGTGGAVEVPLSGCPAGFPLWALARAPYNQCVRWRGAKARTQAGSDSVTQPRRRPSPFLLRQTHASCRGGGEHPLLRVPGGAAGRRARTAGGGGGGEASRACVRTLASQWSERNNAPRIAGVPRRGWKTPLPVCRHRLAAGAVKECPRARSVAVVTDLIIYRRLLDEVDDLEAVAVTVPQLFFFFNRGCEAHQYRASRKLARRLKGERIYISP